MNIFNKIGSRIQKTPFKVLLSTILIFALLIAGAVKVNMATGSETLVDVKNDAYISNNIMEENFGGDSILILFEGEKEDLLSINNIEKMWNVEKQFKYEENIFSFMSPASIVHQMANKQGDKIKENIPEMTDGLSQMSEKLIQIGTELGSKDIPNPNEIESKLDELMGSMDPASAMEDMLKNQEAEMAKMNGQVAKMSGGLGEMGSKLMGIGAELSSKDVPNPQEIEKKLDALMTSLDPDKLMGEMFGEQEAEMAEIEAKVGEMSSQLSQMGNGLIEIGSNFGNMNSPDMSNIEEKLKGLEDISEVFDGLIQGQDNLAMGMTELGVGLSESSSGLGMMASQLKEMAGEMDNPQLKQQLNQISENLEKNSQGLGTMSGKTNGLKEVPNKTSEGLNNIKTNLQKEIKDMKDSLPEDISGDQLKEISNRLTNMGQGLNQFSSNISKLPEEIGESLGGAPSNILSAMMANMEKEIAGMKSNLSGGISPEELQSMSLGFSTMGKNLSEMSGGLSNLPEVMGEALTGADPSAMFGDMTSQIDAEVKEMKSNLSGGIDPEELKTMANGFVTMGENLKNLSEGLETFYSKSGMMVADIPHSQEELDEILYDEDNNLREMFNDVIVDDNHNMMVVKLQGNLDDNYKDIIYADLEEALENEEFKDVSFVVSGKPVLDSSLRDEMKRNMMIMIALAVAIMFIILLLVFHVTWRVLSLGIIFVSVIATLGFMGTLSVPMTMVSMAVFPILIGLGIDYSIQLQNRYEEEKSVKITLTQIGKSVFIAVLATVLGFISLYASPVPMIKDFGKMLTLGVIVSFIGSVFLLMPILHIRDKYGEKLKKTDKYEDGKETRLDKMLKASTKFVLKYSIIIFILVLAVAGFGFSVDSKIGVETDIETFMPRDMEALNDIHKIRDTVGSTNQMAIYMEDEEILTKENIDWIDRITTDIEDRFQEKVVDVKSISTLVTMMSLEEDGGEMDFQEYLTSVEDIPVEQKKMFLNEDKNKSVILLNVSHMSTEDLQEFVIDLEDTVKDAPMDVEVTGMSVLDVEMVKGLTEGRVKMTLIGLGLVFMALLLMYRNLAKAFIPIFPIILIIGTSSGIMYLLGIKYTPITATLGALVLGMGTEMTIMLLERYIEERTLGKDKMEAMLVTVTKIGKATIASGLTTIGGFSVLMASKFEILKDFGLMTVINISLALLSTFIILPMIIMVLDKYIVRKRKIRKLMKEEK